MRAAIAIAAVAIATLSSTPMSAQTVLKVNMFLGAQNLPLFAAREKGFFTKRGLTIESVRTPNSTVQREGLEKGTFDIVQSAVDNAIAMVDVAKKDVVIVAGGSDGMNELMVRQELKNYDDIHGKTIVVDAADTAYALVLYKWLGSKGLKRGSDYKVLPVGACAERMDAMRQDPINRSLVLFNAPCNRLLERNGFKSWGRAVDVIGPYQGDGTFVMRQWASAHGDTLVKYLQALIEGDRWSRMPANRDEAVRILASTLKIDNELAVHSLDAGVGTKGGITPDLRFDVPSFKNTLQIRLDSLGGHAEPNVERYYDLSYYGKAIAGLK